MSKETTEMWSRGRSLLPGNREEDVQAATALQQTALTQLLCVPSSSTTSLPARGISA